METVTLGDAMAAGALAQAARACARTRQISAAVTRWSRFETKSRVLSILRGQVRKMGAS